MQKYKETLLRTSKQYSFDSAFICGSAYQSNVVEFSGCRMHSKPEQIFVSRN